MNNNDEVREEKKKKFDFAKKKENTLHSLKEVDSFLHRINKGFSYIQVFKFFK